MNKARKNDQFLYALLAVIFAASAVIFVVVRPMLEVRALSSELSAIDDGGGIMVTGDLIEQANGL
jgi:hypothetical protein